MPLSFINEEAVRAVKVNSSPFPYFGLQNALDESSYLALLKDFPEINKGGSFSLEDIHIKGSLVDFVKEIESDDFRQLMAEKFSVDLTNKPLIITARGFSRLKDGQVHTDSKTKLLTILIYFNKSWDVKTGRLRMLNSNDVNDVSDEFSSAIGQMIAFKVTDNCWHGYEPFEGQRQSLQINYLVDEKYNKQHIYRHRISGFFKKLLKK